jgi:hypothetical protein
MKRVTLNFIVDSVSFLTLLGLTVTGFIIKSVLPPGSGGHGRELHGGRGIGEIKSLWSMTRHEWGDIHFYLAALFIVLMIVHLVLHWTWIKNCFKSILRPRECEE